MMSEKEWLEIGYSKGIIECQSADFVRFCEIYKDWFVMKSKIVKPQSLDRIEVTYNRYYLESTLSTMFISDISEQDVVNFLSSIVLKNGAVSYKEFGRIMQIVNNVLVYAHDLHMEGSRLYDWDAVKRYVPFKKLTLEVKHEDAVPDNVVRELIYEVMERRIYATKQCACLALCMNFYLGLRVGELAALTFSDFDFDKGVVKVRKTESKFYRRDENGEKLGVMVYRVVDSVKTVNSVREVPMLPEVRKFYCLIKEEHERRKYESEYICFDGNETILTRSLDRTLRRLCLLCDVQYFNSHMIRKTFATRLHFSGVPTRVISDLLGHSEIGTTENSYILNYGNNYDNLLLYLKGGLNYYDSKK